MSKEPKELYYYPKNDRENYAKLMVKSNALLQDYDPDKTHPAVKVINGITYLNTFGLKGLSMSDPNALLERLDLLLASKEASHTGVRNE